MPLGSAEIEQIGTYVRANLAEWMEDIVGPKLLGRTVRVEDELAFQRELITSRFEAADKRFEDMLHRFDTVDKRFEDMHHRFDAVDKRFEDLHRRHGDATNVSVDKAVQRTRRASRTCIATWTNVSRRWTSGSKTCTSGSTGCNGWWAAGWCCSPP